MTQLEHIEAIENRLWNAADMLRANSNYASNEYFLPVMGLVFLRHAYSRYLAVKDGIEANLPTRGGKTRTLTKEDFSQQSAMIVGKKLSREDAKARREGTRRCDHWGTALTRSREGWGLVDEIIAEQTSGLRAFASSRESECRGAREDAILREMENFLQEL